MKKTILVIKWLTLSITVAAIAACAFEPLQSDRAETIIGAPDWVNKGSYFTTNRDGNMFYGVSSANPQGDLALQKSIADDRANAEVVRVLVTFLDAVTFEFLSASRYEDSSAREDATYRRIEANASRQVKQSISAQIDDAIVRQFKGGVSTQFKDDVTNNVTDAAARDIKESISFQIDFLRHVEDVITKQLKEAASRQMKSTAQAHLANARNIGNWRDPRTNAIWSISELNLKNVKKTMSGINDINIELKQYFDINAENIFDRIIRERNNLNPFSFK
jgi:hypothetical protein